MFSCEKGEIKKLESNYSFQLFIWLQPELATADNILENITADASHASLLTTGLRERDPTLDKTNAIMYSVSAFIYTLILDYGN